MGFFSRSKKLEKHAPVPLPPHSSGPFQLPPNQAALMPFSHPGPPPAWPSSNGPPQPPYLGPPIVVNQHYHFTPSPQAAVPFGPPLPPPPARYPYSGSSSSTGAALSKLKLGSMVDLANDVTGTLLHPIDQSLSRCQGYGSQVFHQGNAAVDDIYTSLTDVLSLIDCDRYRGHEKALYGSQPMLPPSAPQAPFVFQQPQPLSDAPGTRALGLGKKDRNPRKQREHPKPQTASTPAVSGNYFAKVDLYANSKLPLNLPPMKLYLPTYPLLSLAAQYSSAVYDPPSAPSEESGHVTTATTTHHLSPSLRAGTKAMLIKSLPLDYPLDTIVFAIRGTSTASLTDWAVNLRTEPTPPLGFLDDPGNLCHAGFLAVARRSVPVVADRLRRLLQEDPTRAGRSSLLITGHSAGGAVAQLLYAHMLSTSRDARSELNALAGCFRRVHCVAFGAPPVSLLPLQTPAGVRNSLFLSFVNEGDPVCRADRAYVRSLVDLLAAPAPAVATQRKKEKEKKVTTTSTALQLSSLSLISPAAPPAFPPRRPPRRNSNPSASASSLTTSNTPTAVKPTWPVPPATLSNAGRLIVLRSGDPGASQQHKKTIEQRLADGVVAQVVTDEQLRGVVWGDPVAHVMALYAARIETLAVGAVTAQGG